MKQLLTLAAVAGIAIASIGCGSAPETKKATPPAKPDAMKPADGAKPADATKPADGMKKDDAMKPADGAKKDEPKPADKK